MKPCQFFEKSCIFPMTEVWADHDNDEYVYISLFEIIIFATEDKTMGYLSIINSDMKAYTLAVGERYTFFLSKH